MDEIEHEYLAILDTDDAGAVEIMCTCGWIAKADSDSEADEKLSRHIDHYESLKEAAGDGR